MNYPLITEYIESIRSSSDNFDKLSNLRPVLDEEGNPVMTSGNFAVVFKMKDEQTDKLFAVKCFLKEQAGRAESYKLIVDELKKVNSTYVVQVEYYDKELFVDTNQSDETEFPVLIMDWVEGITLEQYVKEHVKKGKQSEYDVRSLKQIALDFCDFANWLILQEFAHGDIKPDNIIIKNNKEIVLVDYDGMYVPKMKGKKAREIGSPNYRSPYRTIDIFDSTIDNFSLSVIAFSLAAIAINKSMYNGKIADALVFSDDDYRDFNNPSLLKKVGTVLHDRLCSSLFSALLLQISNPNARVDFDTLFSLKSYISAKPPKYLPFKVSDYKFYLCDTNNGESKTDLLLSDAFFVNDSRNDAPLIISKGGEIDYFESTGGFTVTAYILYEESQKRPKANQFALFTNTNSLENLQWFDFIKKINDSIFLAKKNETFGIISKDNMVLLPFVYKVIKPIRNNYVICQNDQGNSGLFSIHENNVNEIMEVKYDEKHWFYNNTASDPDNLIVFNDGNWKGYDLERGCFISLPPRIRLIKEYSENIICCKMWDSGEGDRLYDVDRRHFIDNDLYINASSPFVDGFTICETKDHKNVIVSKDGTKYIIPYEANTLRRGNNSKYVFYNYIILGDQYSSKCDIEVTIFDYRVKKTTSFIYHWDAYGEKCISVEDDQFVEISSYRMKYDHSFTLAILDFYGNPINRKEDKVIAKEQADKQIHFDEQLLLKHVVNSQFINASYIPNIAKYYEGVNCITKNGYIAVWGIIDVDPEFGVSSELIGYADANRCYWDIDSWDEDNKVVRCTMATQKDWENHVKDASGASYTSDWKKLLSPGSLYQEKFDILNGTEIITDGAFNDLGSEIDYSYIEKIIIPQSIKQIGHAPFNKFLNELVCLSPYFEFENNTLYSKGKRRLIQCFSKSEEFIVPHEVEYIDNHAFYGCKSKKIVISESVNKIGINPFIEMDIDNGFLEVISLSPKFVVDNNSLYENNSKLISYWGKGEVFTIPDGIKEVGEYAFFASDLKTIHLPDSIEFIGDCAFGWCFSLHEVLVPAKSAEKFKRIMVNYQGMIRIEK